MEGSSAGGLWVVEEDWGAEVVGGVAEADGDAVLSALGVEIDIDRADTAAGEVSGAGAVFPADAEEGGDVGGVGFEACERHGRVGAAVHEGFGDEIAVAGDVAALVAEIGAEAGGGEEIEGTGVAAEGRAEVDPVGGDVGG